MIFQQRGYHDSKEGKATFSMKAPHLTIKSNEIKVKSRRKVVIIRHEAEVLLYLLFYEADDVAIIVLIFLTI